MPGWVDQEAPLSPGVKAPVGVCGVVPPPALLAAEQAVHLGWLWEV